MERTEAFFWHFCDDYLELVKSRAYGESEGDSSAGTTSARTALSIALGTLHRLFAPFLPFTTEEVWSWCMDGSVHNTPWPTVDEFDGAASGDTNALGVASEVLSAIRGAKSAAKVGMGADVALVTVSDTEERLAPFELVRADVQAAGKVVELRTESGESFSVSTEFE